MKKRLFSILLSLALMIGMMPVFGMSMSAYADDPIYTVKFSGNENTKSIQVSTLPYTFSCASPSEPGAPGNGELDKIIRELYGLLDGHCIPEAPTVTGGGTNVEAGLDVSSNQYITINSKFDGAVTVEGKYYDGINNIDYSINITCSDIIEYPLWVGDTQVTSANKDDVFKDGKVSYTPATDTDAAVLKLKNYNNNGSVREWEGRSAAIYANENLTIELNGNNTLTNTATGNRTSAIVADHDLTFKGKGRLAADCPNGGCIAVNGDLTIEDGIIEATGTVSIGGSKQITIAAGTIKATGTSAGIFAFSGLTIKGGTVEATASDDESFGIGVYGDAMINDGKVIASSPNIAIYASKGVKNKIAGTAWTNVAGSAGKADIAVGNHASEELSSYKKVQFPAEPISAKPVLAAKGIVKGKKAVKISWNSVSGAAKYEVYFSRCNANGKKYTPKFKGSTTGNSMIIKKLRKGRCYKFYVVAKDSKGNVVSQSLVGHFIAGNVKGKRTNAKSLTLGASSVSLSKGAAYKITAKQKKVRKGKKLLNSGHAPLLRYVSDNPSVANVDGSGNIKAVDAGTCTVYVQTVNGIWKTVAVTVK